MSENHYLLENYASLEVQRLKRLPAMWETWVLSVGREDPLEKDMATHSSILAWRIPWMEELGGLQSTGRKESDTTERLHFTHSTPSPHFFQGRNLIPSLSIWNALETQFTCWGPDYVLLLLMPALWKGCLRILSSQNLIPTCFYH